MVQEVPEPSGASFETQASLAPQDEGLLDLGIRLPRLPDESREHPEQGQSSSLAIALESIPDGEDFCIMLGDLPLVKAEAAESLCRKFLQMPENKSVLAPSRDGIFGHPIFYRSVWRDRFRLASGDVGGKKILMKYECEIMRTKVSDEHFKDIDTPEEYRNLLRT